MTAKLDIDCARRMVIAPISYTNLQISAQLKAALAEIDLLRPVVDAAERWTDSGAVHDEVLMGAVRAYRRARSA